ncbi:MAG TPA: stage V sporulation protein S [Anaerolineae bacterium]|nr:stage V sporulation protein S [Anaerolineae bacterium]HID84899.1 stage V sporulation protein S [Anaerolineales bacterium]HIQ07929.1 stage V sporulation protein S [Anaerolineaceae bacterium]
MDIIKVSGNSRTSAVAGAIAGVFREHRRAEVQAIGAGAVNQAVKALVLARSYLAEDGLNVAFVAGFTDVTINEKVRTAIKFTVVEFPGELPLGDEDTSQEEASAA